VVGHDRDLDGVVVGRAGAAGVGTGGMVTKLEAARIATGSGIATLLTSADRAAEALAGADVGTWFAPTAPRASTRLLWLAHAASAHGRLVLDDGAVTAVVRDRASLLPAGVVEVSGHFEPGDPVDLCDQNGRIRARGLVNYSSGELPGLLGRSTRELGRTLGPGYDRELVHRDDLVLLER
jgi:glutamate 5-kinase